MGLILYATVVICICNRFFGNLFGLDLYCEDEDILSEPCMANVKKRSKKLRCAVGQLKKARSRMTVFFRAVLLFSCNVSECVILLLHCTT